MTIDGISGSIVVQTFTTALANISTVKKLTNETPHGTPPPIFSRPLMERERDKVVAGDKERGE